MGIDLPGEIRQSKSDFLIISYYKVIFQSKYRANTNFINSSWVSYHDFNAFCFPQVTVCLLIKGSHSSPVLQKFTSPWGTEVTLPYFNHFDSFLFLYVIIIFLIFWNSKDVNPLDQSIILNVEYILFILKLIFYRKSVVSPVSSSNM